MFIKSHAPVHGDCDQIHSTRGELFGILACMRHIQYICKNFKFRPNSRIPIYTDSTSSIYIAKSPLYISYKIAFCADADVKAEVRSTYKALSKIVSLHHVKARQDDKLPFR